ncbi:G-protein alpha subunit [Mycena floridula]|nr:G-protein alpha subunit [Mycena floridula]
MGNAASSKSAAIDKQLRAESKRSDRESKVLLLGSPHSGKSTILKQIQIVHRDGFSEHERKSYATSIRQDVLVAGQAFVRAMQQHTTISRANERFVKTIMTSETFSPQFADAIYRLWRDPERERIMEQHPHALDVMSNAPYFFTQTLRIGSPDWIPNDMDILMAPDGTSNGVADIRFSFDQTSMHIYDVRRQQLGRPKWLHCFEGVTTVIFCVSLTEYAEILPGDSGRTALMQSIAMFEHVVNAPWFSQTSVVLLFNKIDLFRQQLEQKSLQHYFPDFREGDDSTKAAKHILSLFNAVNRAGLTIYPHLIQATDTTSIGKVFANERTILKNDLHD